MNQATKLVSLVALMLTLIPSLLFFGGLIGHSAVKVLCLVGTVVWFVVTPMWMSRKLSVDAAEVEI